MCQPLAARAQQAAPRITFSLETTRDRFRYRFENPSSFNTAELVPHEFTQTYWGDNTWFVIRGRFNIGVHPFESEFAATPQRSTRGDDYDTFFQPSGDVVVAGTTGQVSMRSFRIREIVGLGHRAGLDWNVGYGYRRDRSIFDPGLKTISHTEPSSLEASMIYTRETTISENIELQFGSGRSWAAGKWRARLGADLAPVSRARLTTRLPDKYPGQDIVFSAIVMTLQPAFVLSYGDRWPISVTAGYTRTFSYVKSHQLERSPAAVGVGLGWSRR
jgi:hypothetical protein